MDNDYFLMVIPDGRIRIIRTKDEVLSSEDGHSIPLDLAKQQGKTSVGLAHNLEVIQPLLDYVKSNPLIMHLLVPESERTS